MHEHLEHHGDRVRDILATVLAAATASGGSDTLREKVHILAGLWGDCAAVLVSGLTVLWWGLRLADTLLDRWRRRHARPDLGGPLGSATLPPGPPRD